MIIDTIQTVLRRQYLCVQGSMNGIEENVTRKANTTPAFSQPRDVSYAVQPQVETELTCLTEQGVTSPKQYSELPRLQPLTL